MVTSGGCMGWLKQRTNLEKTLLSLSSLLILTLLLLILIGITVHDPGSGDDSGDESGCMTKECIITAGQVLPVMDEGADPCEDFYGYACGNYGGKPGQTSSAAQASVEAVYLHSKDLLESSTRVEVANFDTARSLYTACMQFDGLHRERKESAYLLLELMDRFGVGNWPVVSTVYEDSELTISDRLASLALLGVPVAFSARVVPDPRTRGAFLLKLSPGGPLEVGRPAIDIRKDHELRTYMLFSLLLLGAPTYLRATTAVDDILSVDAYYATVQQDSERLCDTVDTLVPEESLHQLNNMMPEMNWTSLVSRIQKEAGLQRPFAVEVHCKAKIRDFLVHLNDVTIRISHNYLGWRFFESFAKHIGPTFGRPQSHSEPGAPRWKECVLLLEKYAGPMLGVALKQHFIHPGTADKMQRLSRNALSAAKKLLSMSHWLSPDQKRRIAQQVEAAKEVLTDTSPKNSSVLDHLRLPTVKDDNYTAVVIGLRKERIIQNLKRLDPATRNQHPSLPWEMYLTSEAALKSLIFFDKIREPYLRTHGPDWMNYGGYGVFAARESAADLLPDGPGSPSEDSTSLWDLWSKNRSASACVRNLSSKHFRVNFLRMDAEETLLRDLFLDIGALEIALQGAEDSAESGSSLPGMTGRSDAQMFYIAYAQTLCEEKHSEKNAARIPVRNRMNTLVSNSHVFAKAFSCSSSSVAKKCRIWS